MNMDKFIRCSCGSEILHLEADTCDINEGKSTLITGLYISFFTIGHCGKVGTWRNRLRHIWYIIKYGTPYSDDIILDSEGMGELKEFMDMITLRYKDTVYRKQRRRRTISMF